MCEVQQAKSKASFNHSKFQSFCQEDKIDPLRLPEYELLKDINKALYSGDGGRGGFGASI